MLQPFGLGIEQICEHVHGLLHVSHHTQQPGLAHFSHVISFVTKVALNPIATLLRRYTGNTRVVSCVSAQLQQWRHPPPSSGVLHAWHMPKMTPVYHD